MLILSSTWEAAYKGDTAKDVKLRIGKATNIFRKSGNQNLSALQTVAIPVITYARET